MIAHTCTHTRMHAHTDARTEKPKTDLTAKCRRKHKNWCNEKTRKTPSSEKVREVSLMDGIGSVRWKGIILRLKLNRRTTENDGDDDEWAVNMCEM